MQTITFGKYTGQTIDTVPLPWLVWVVTRYNIRRAYPAFVRSALAELARRVNTDLDAAVEDLTSQKTMPPLARPVRGATRSSQAHLLALQRQALQRGVKP